MRRAPLLLPLLLAACQSTPSSPAPRPALDVQAMTLPGRVLLSNEVATSFQTLTPFVRLANAEGTALVDTAVGRGQTDGTGQFTLEIDRAALEARLVPIELIQQPPGCSGGRQISAPGALTSYPLMVALTGTQANMLTVLDLERERTNDTRYTLEYVQGSARVTADEVCAFTAGGVISTTTLKADIEYTPGWNVVERRAEGVLAENNGGVANLTYTFRKLPLPSHFLLIPVPGLPGFQPQSLGDGPHLLKGW